MVRVKGTIINMRLPYSCTTLNKIPSHVSLHGLVLWIDVWCLKMIVKTKINKTMVSSFEEESIVSLKNAWNSNNSNDNALHGQLWNQFICGAKRTNITQFWICWYKVSPDFPQKRTDIQSFYQKRSSIVCQCFWFSNAPHRKYSVQILQLRLMVPYVFFPPPTVLCTAAVKMQTPSPHLNFTRNLSHA